MNGITHLSTMLLNSVERIHAISGIVTLTLAHFVWQGIVVAILFMLASLALRSRSANARYLTSVVALFALAVGPIVTFALSSTAISMRTPTLIEFETKSALAGSCSFPSKIPSEQFDSAAPPTFPLSVANVPSNQKVTRWTEFSSPWIASCYLLGVMVMLLRFVRGIARGRECRTLSEPLLGQTIHRRMVERCRVWSMRCVPVMACCQKITVPVVVGVVRPMILVPPAILTGFTVDQIESMLIHELAHIRRHDPLIHFLQRIVESVLFFHPAVWYVSRRMNIEREIACDDFVIASGWSASDYASTLLELADRNIAGATEWKATLLAASGDRPSQFKQRILRLLGEEQSRPQFDFKSTECAVVFLLLVSACGIFVGRSTVLAQSPVASIVIEGDEGGDSADTSRSNSPVSPKSPGHAIALRGWGFDVDLVFVESPFWRAVFKFLTQPKVNEGEQNVPKNVQDNLELHDASKGQKKSSAEHQYLFSAVLIEGNSSIPVQEIEKHIKVRANQTITQSQIKDDVDELVRTRWFARIEPTLRESSDGDQLVFQVLERPIVRCVEYKGLKKIKQKVFDNLTQLKPGSPFDVASNRECARRIEEYYHDKGFAFATVELEKGNERDDREVVFLIHEGPKVKVSAVSFEGGDVFSAKILKTVAQEKMLNRWFFGGKYNPSTIANDIANVKRYYHMLGFFDAEVNDHLKFSDDKSEVEIHYEVAEGIRYKVRNIEIEGNMLMSEEELRESMELREGVPFNARDIKKDVETMKLNYAKRGRSSCRIGLVPGWSERGVVDLKYRINEGRADSDITRVVVPIEIGFPQPLITPPSHLQKSEKQPD